MPLLEFLGWLIGHAGLTCFLCKPGEARIVGQDSHNDMLEFLPCVNVSVLAFSSFHAIPSLVIGSEKAHGKHLILVILSLCTSTNFYQL